MSLIFENVFTGLWNGPVDHKASSIINAICNTSDPTNFGLIGEADFIISPSSAELLPQVSFIDSVANEDLFYGIVVGGNKDGIYLTGGTIDIVSLDSRRLVATSGDAVRLCTQGRCIASVATRLSDGGAIAVGDPLRAAAGGHLAIADASGDLVVARALQAVAEDPVLGAGSFMAVDIQREGKLP